MLEANTFQLTVLGRSRASLPPQTTWHYLDLSKDYFALPTAHAETLLHTTALWLLPEWIEKFHERGVRRIIAFSSTSRFTKTNSASKYELEVVNKLVAAEALVVSECERLGIAWTIFRPTLIYGGLYGDRNIGDIARLICRFGFFPVFGKASGLRQPVRASDLANACLLALNAPPSYNRAYNLSGGETVTYRSMVRKVFEMMGKRPVFLPVPVWMFRLAVKLGKLHPRFTHLTPDMALRMQTDLVFDHSDATADFGYTPDIFTPDYLKRWL